MRVFTILVVVLINSFLVACSNRQPPAPIYDKVIPGSNILSDRHFAPHSIIYEKVGSKMRVDLSKITFENKALYKVEIAFDLGGKNIPDTIYFHQDNLGYYGRVLTMPAYTIDVRYQNGLFKGHLQPSTESDLKAVEYNKPYPHSAFEPAMIPYFISALPLSDGYQASIPVFDLNNGSQMFWSNIEVVARETIQIDHQSYDTWKVISDGIKHKTLWIPVGKAYAVKMETAGAMGSWEATSIKEL